jgi:RNA polymerase sigma-70 factor (ECF subfamily)
MNDVQKTWDGRVGDAYRVHHDSLLNFLTRQLANRQEAEDVVQDTYLKFCSIRDIDGIEDTKAFLFRVAKNLAIDLRRRQAVRQVAGEELRFDAVDYGTPEMLLDSKQHLMKLQAAIDRLPDRCRTVFILHRYHGKSHHEIAQALGITTHAVEKHMMRALKRCQKNIRQDEGRLSSHSTGRSK